jgi:hypothetical protein
LSGLIGIEALDAPQYDAQRSGLLTKQSAPGRGVVGLRSAGGQAVETAATPTPTRLLAAEREEEPQNYSQRMNGKASYVVAEAASSAAGVQA